MCYLCDLSHEPDTAEDVVALGEPESKSEYEPQPEPVPELAAAPPSSELSRAYNWFVGWVRSVSGASRWRRWSGIALGLCWVTVWIVGDLTIGFWRGLFFASAVWRSRNMMGGIDWRVLCGVYLSIGRNSLGQYKLKNVWWRLICSFSIATWLWWDKVSEVRLKEVGLDDIAKAFDDWEQST